MTRYKDGFARSLPLMFLSLFILLGLMASPAAGVRSVFSVRGPGGAGGVYVPSFSPYHQGLALLGTDMGAAFRSDDGATTWELIHFQNHLRYMQHSAFPAYFPDKIFWNTGLRSLAVSRDKGVTWETLPDKPWKKSRIKQLGALPGSPDVLLVGVDDGVWRTEDDGNRWQKVLNRPVSEFVVLGDTVFTAAMPCTLLVSTDRGKTWRGRDIVVDGRKCTANPVLSLTGGVDAERILLLASLKGIGVAASVDGGATWELGRDSNNNLNHLVMDPKQTGNIFAAQVGSVRYNKVFRSVDGGRNWESIFHFAPSWKKGVFKKNVEASWVQNELGWGYYITNRGLAVDPHDPAHLVLTTQGDIYETRNGGDSWKQAMNRVVAEASGDNPPRYQSIGLEVTSAWKYRFDPNKPNIHYILYSDIGFLRSEDSGQSWSWAARGSPWKNTFYQIAFDPDVPGRIYAATSRRHDIPHYLALSRTVPSHRTHRGGVVVSNDYGKKWRVPYGSKDASGLPQQVCTTIALDPKSSPDSRVLYAGIYGEQGAAGVYRSEDGGKSWVKRSGGLGVSPNHHVYRVLIHPKSGNLYCVITGLRLKGATFTVPGGIWKSTDEGRNWTHISKGSDLNWHTTSLWIDPEDEKEMLVTATSPPGKWLKGGLYRTRNGGKSWDHILTDKQIAKAAGGSSFDHTMSVAVHPDDPDIIYVGTTHHGLLVSRNDGRTWESYEAFPFNIAQSINFPPSDHSRIIVTTFGAGVWEGPALPPKS